VQTRRGDNAVECITLQAYTTYRLYDPRSEHKIPAVATS
jgi:hypothetical protein